MQYSIRKSFGAETIGREQRTFAGYTYYAISSALASIAELAISPSQILSEGPLVRNNKECPSIMIDKTPGTPSAGPWIATQKAAGNAIVFLSDVTGGTLAATRDIELASILTSESEGAGVLYEPSAGWIAPVVPKIEIAGKDLPSWVLPVSIGGGVLLIGLVAYLALRK